jgi:4-carboxymuconolactone decarboxylase
MGDAQPQLKYHINGALNVGWSGAEVIEAILLSTVYAGFPAALNGVFAAKEVFQARGIGIEVGQRENSEKDRYARGLHALQQVTGASGTDVIQSLQDIAPDLACFIIEFSYGDVISRPGLDNRTREIASVSMLTALATARPQLKVHLSAALNVGATRQELTEAILQMALYAGFPAGLNGMAAAREVFVDTADDHERSFRQS